MVSNVRAAASDSSSATAPASVGDDCPAAVTLRADATGVSAELVTPGASGCSVKAVSVGKDDAGRDYLDASSLGIEVVESLPLVKVINLSRNKITKMLPSTNAIVVQLELSSNGIQNFDSIKIPPAVSRLVLDGNKIATFYENMFSPVITDISLKNNGISTLSGFTFSDAVIKLDLSLNMLPQIDHFVMPSQLTSFTCENCQLEKFGGVVFSSNLRTFNLKQNLLEMMEISNSSANILKRLEDFFVATKIGKCDDVNAKLSVFQDTNLCILDDKRFNAKYKLNSGGAANEQDVLGDDDTVAGGTATTGSASGSSSKWTKLAIAGGGAVVLIALCVAAVLVYKRRRGYKKKQNHFQNQDKMDLDELNDGPSSTGPTQYIHGMTSTLTGGTTTTPATHSKSKSSSGHGKSSGASSSHSSSSGSWKNKSASTNDSFPNDVRTDDSLQHFRLLSSDITRGKLIARGGYGAVYLATFRQETVVMKQMLPDKTRNKQIIKSFMDEIRICATLDHPKVVKFIGITWTTLQDLSVVLEYQPNGDLAALLMDQHQREMTFPGAHGGRSGFGWFHSKGKLKCKSLIALDIAEALVYLHSFESPIIHRDLKPKNVLMSENWTAKLTDFGISREKNEDLTMTAEIGTVAWIAPEVLKGERYSEMADVYSFGVILTELDTCRRPFSNNQENGGYSNTRIAVLVSSGQLKPSLHRDCPQSVRKLAKKCLAFRPEDRPSALQIHYELRNLDLDDEEVAILGEASSSIPVVGGAGESRVKGGGSRVKGAGGSRVKGGTGGGLGGSAQHLEDKRRPPKDASRGQRTR